MEDLDYKYDVLSKICMTGDCASGKSCLMARFAHGIFREYIGPTVGIEFSSKKIEHGDKTIKLQIWDIAGRNRYNAMNFAYYRGAIGVLLCFDTTNPKSIEEFDEWMEEINLHTKGAFVILVGCKSDLKEDRAVDEEKIEEFVRKKNVDYIEISSKDNIGINELSDMIVEKIMEMIGENGC